MKKLPLIFRVIGNNLRANEATSEVVEAFELFLTDIQKLKESLSPAKNSSSHFDYEELNKLIEMIEAEIAERGEDTTKEQNYLVAFGSSNTSLVMRKM